MAVSKKISLLTPLCFVSIVLMSSQTPVSGMWVAGAEAGSVTITAANDDGEGQLVQSFPSGLAVLGEAWNLPGGDIVNDNGDVIATVDSLVVILGFDPQVSLGFSVLAGGSDTNIAIQTTTLSFTPLTNPDAYATASVTVTDRNLNGALITGLFPGDKMYEARYNGSIAWADLVDPVAAAPGDSEIGKERKPELPTLWGTISDTANSIEAEYNFTLSANDYASGTSAFEIVPEPTTLLLFGLSLAMLGRKRA